MKSVISVCVPGGQLHTCKLNLDQPIADIKNTLATLPFSKAYDFGFIFRTSYTTFGADVLEANRAIAKDIVGVDLFYLLPSKIVTYVSPFCQAGFMLLQPYDFTSYTITKFLIFDAHRRERYGTKLLSNIIQQADDCHITLRIHQTMLGYEECGLSTNELRCWLNRWGFFFNSKDGIWIRKPNTPYRHIPWPRFDSTRDHPVFQQLPGFLIARRLFADGTEGVRRYAFRGVNVVFTRGYYNAFAACVPLDNVQSKVCSHSLTINNKTCVYIPLNKVFVIALNSSTI